MVYDVSDTQESATVHAVSSAWRYHTSHRDSSFPGFHLREAVCDVVSLQTTVGGKHEVGKHGVKNTIVLRPCTVSL